MRIMKTLRLKGNTMTRIAVSIIKTMTFILGIVLASCFIGRGGGKPGKEVVGV